MKPFSILWLGFCLCLASLPLISYAEDWQRTVIFISSETQPGQDIFLRGGIDHQFAQNNLRITCSNSNSLCAIPIRYRNTLNTYTANWKKGDNFLDWYGTEASQNQGNQAGLAQGTVMDWTSNNPNNAQQLANQGFGFTPLNTWGDHYWMLDVDMDCSKTYRGWFEFKSFIARGAGWESDIHQADTPYPSPNHFAQCGKINVFQRNANSFFTQELALTSAIASSIFLQVDRSDGYLFVFVNGIERMRFDSSQARAGEKIDITSLMWQGANEIRLVASTPNGQGGYAVKLWADEKQLLNESNFHNNRQGISLNKSISVNMPDAPASRTLSISTQSRSESAIYINNVFTGKFAPAEFQLAPGEYRLGIGESTTTVDKTPNSVAMTGQFREQDIVIAGQNLSLDSEQIPLLTRVSEHKIAIIPFTNLHCGFSNEAVISSGLSINAFSENIGVMTAEDILVAEQAIKLTSEKWLQPMSYGLMKWKLQMLAPITQKVYMTDHLRLEDNIQFSDDLGKYDMVIYIMPDRTLNRDSLGRRIPVISAFGGAGGRPVTFMPASWLDAPGQTLAERLQNLTASSGMGHEALHVYGGYAQNDYQGVENLHGALAHSYGENDRGFIPAWLSWQQHFVRSQVAEDQTTDLYITPAQKPARPALYVGLFNTLHAGLGAEQLWSYSKPVSRIENLGDARCLDLQQIEGTDRIQIRGVACNTQNSQRWSLKHVQNGAYHMVNESSQKCAELSEGQILQKACSSALPQRFLIKHSSGSFSITTLANQCLALNGNGSLALTSCDPLATSQQWHLKK
ncbi:MAG TPA: RICIN domain-containing protein [Cellvibrio sp.]|nr:RICIN domain-containing protein [Cellvibrio sp.]